MTARLFDDRRCTLGEGAFWHPLRRQFYWFDILGRRLLTVEGGRPKSFDFPQMVSALGWVSEHEAVMAAESGLLRVDLRDGSFTPLVEVEAGQPATRSNDGRADRQGGFWWGTMSKRGGQEPGKGAIWRWYRGELRKIIPDLTIPNAICFSPDGRLAYYTDTETQIVLRQPLDAEGWPEGEAEVFLDLRRDGLFADGAVVDAEGVFWNAQWGAGRVAAYAPDGRFLRDIPVPAPHSSCPAFGGDNMANLLITTAREGMSEATLAALPEAGSTYLAQGVARGLPEPRVIL